MISAFGARAERYARLIGDLDAIVADPDHVGDAYLEAVRRREAGETFYGLMLTEDSRIAFGYRHTAEILSHFSDFDRRRAVLDRLAGGSLPVNSRRADEIWRPEEAFEQILVEWYGLCDAILVRSFAEYAHIVGIFARHPVRRPLRPVQRVLARVDVPVVSRVRPEMPALVVWAPLRPAIETALICHGLLEFHGEVTVVSAGGALPAYARATFVPPGDPRVDEALARSAVVICAEPNDPADAVAFARLGYGVIAPITSGAVEFAGDVVPWDAIDARFLFTNVAVAMARPAKVYAEPVPPPRAPERPERPAFVSDPPLVSIVTATYNRRTELREVLGALAAQTYPNIEAIIVNDAGEPVADIVAQFPFARLIDLPENGGAAHAFETGRAQVRGEYIAVLPDDDWYYPDHIDRLMNAIFRSGCRVVHGAALLRYLERLESGAWITTGFNAATFSETLAPSESLVTATFGAHQALVATSVYDDVGWYLPDSLVADQEIQTRICKRYFYAFADHVTAEFRDHATSTGRQSNFIEALTKIYNEVHPVPERPQIQQYREDALRNIAARPPGQPPFTATLKILKRPS